MSFWRAFIVHKDVIILFTISFYPLVTVCGIFTSYCSAAHFHVNFIFLEF